MILQIRNRPGGQGYLMFETVNVKEICAPEMLYLYIRLNMDDLCIGLPNDMIWYELYRVYIGVLIQDSWMGSFSW